MVSNQTNQDRLADLIQSLPAELYNHILDLTLTFSSPALEINSTYKPPIQLQISSSLRSHLAPTYYSTTTFAIKYVNYRLFDDWFQSIPPKYRNETRTIRFDELEASPYFMKCRRYGVVFASLSAMKCLQWDLDRFCREAPGKKRMFCQMEGEEGLVGMEVLEGRFGTK